MLLLYELLVFDIELCIAIGITIYYIYLLYIVTTLNLRVMWMTIKKSQL